MQDDTYFRQIIRSVKIKIYILTLNELLTILVRNYKDKHSLIMKSTPCMNNYLTFDLNLAGFTSCPGVFYEHKLRSL